MARPVPPDTDAAPQGESPRKSLKLANGTVLTLTASGSDADVLNLDLALEAAKRSAERPLRTTDVRPLVGESPAIKELLHLVDRVKATNVAVLITGENGTGKEVVARLIHTGSPRAKGPFVAVNCS
ncbi:MAG: sigma 54-interacting transcriptional regulator, partial [Myxococcales bacterium]|nr:sigma 54-interacting transcriptional regulator [Myxococcales bacterium]